MTVRSDVMEGPEMGDKEWKKRHNLDEPSIVESMVVPCKAISMSSLLH